MRIRGAKKHGYLLIAVLVFLSVLFCASALAEGYPESAHPYKKNSDITWTYTHPVETYELKVTFSSSTEFEYNYDFLYVTGEDGVVQTFTGTQLQGRTITVSGDSFTIRLVSDSSENEYGFAITHIAEPDFVVKNGILIGYTGTGGVITVPDIVTQIGDSAFSGCSGLTSVTLPEGVVSIGANAFAGCTGLTSVTLPASLTSISSTAFANCGSFTASVVFDSPGHSWCAANQIPYVFCSPFESAHPYANNANTSWTYVHPRNVSVLKVAFSAETEFENNYDFLYITGEDGVEKKYTGTQLQGQKIEVSGSRFTVRLTSDSSAAKYGFRITSIAGYTQSEYNEDLNNQSLYTFNDSGVITGYKGTQSSVVIPPVIDGVRITAIGNRAFSNSTSISSVTIPEGVTSIGDSAFYNCTTLKSVVFPDSLTTIGAYAFSGSGLASINLGENVTTLGERAFYGCASLKSITLTNNLTNIGTDALRCAATSVTVNQTILDAQIYQVYAGNYVNVVNFAEGVEDTGTRISILYGLDNVATVNLSSTMKTIGEMAFYNHPSLRSVNNTGSLETIGNRAFEGCSSLTSLVLPEGLTSLGTYAFSDCALSSIIIPSTLKHVPEHAFARNNARSLHISDGVESIGRYALYSNSFTSVSIPSSVKTIESDAFYYCKQLKTVTLAEGIETIGLSAFMDCTALENITIPSTVTDLGYNAFHTCTSLKSATILSPSIELKNYLFNSCPALESLTFAGSVTAIGTDVFSYSNTIKSVTFMEGTTFIADGMLSGHTALTSLSLPSTLKSIGANAFSGCTGLQTVILPGSITNLGSGAFTGCTSLTAVVKNGSAAHNYCRNNAISFIAANEDFSGSSITASGTCTSSVAWVIDTDGKMTFFGSGIIPDYGSYSSTPWYAYKNSVTTLIIGEGITRIGNNTFDSFDYVQHISLPSTLKEIGGYAFYGCDRLTSIDLPDGLTSIAYSAFGSCYALKSISLPDSVTDLGETVFANNTSLASVRLSPNITTIRNSAFNNTPKLTAIEIPQGITTIMLNAFSSSGLTQVSLPLSVSSIDYTAFSFCPETLTISCHADSYAAQYAAQWSIALNLEPHTETPVPGAEADCLTDGMTEGSWCPVCEKTLIEQETIPAAGHDEVIDEAVDPTCTLPGRTEGSHCGTCLEVLLAQEDIPALGHVEITIPGFAPTCTESGLTDYLFCETCGEELQLAEEIAATGHTDSVTVEALAPTCTEAGRTEGHGCSVCGEVLTASTEIPASGHSDFVSAEAVQPDCVTTGLTEEHSCSICEEVLVPAEVIPALGHTPEADAPVAPDCLNPGLTEGSHCSICGEVLTAQETVDALGHTPETDAAVAPTDRETGLTEGSHCSVCGETLVEQTIIPANFAFDGDTVTAYNGTATDVVIPEGVSALGNTLFKGNTSITSVRVPDSVTAVGTQTFFGCTSLTDVWLPDHLTDISAQAFYNVSARIHADPDSATAIALSYRGIPFATEDGFRLRYRVTSATGTPTAIWIVAYHGSETHLILPDMIGSTSVAQIQTNAFSGCSQLASIRIPDGVNSIADDAFAGCSEQLIIRSSAEAYARSWASQNGFTWEHDQHTEDLLEAVEPTCTDEGKTEGLWCSGCGEVLLEQESVAALGHTLSVGQKLYEMIEGSDLTLPEVVAVCCHREELAFIWTSSHEEKLTISDQMLHAAHAGVAEVTVTAEGGQSSECSFRVVIHSDQQMLMPRDLTMIEAEAFANTAAEEIIVPEGVVSIGKHAFANSENLLLVTLPNSLTDIDSKAFEGSVNVTILCSEGSFAADYADAHDISFIIQ